MSAQTLLITGAKGTVGNYVVTLAEMAGYRVIASDLTASGISVPVRGDVRPADLRDRAAVRRVVQGCDAVIHTAAQLRTSASPAELAQVNTDATAQLYEAARQAGVKRFVHMSTATLYAPDPFSSGTEEASVIAPRGAYGMSKHGAEIFLLGQRRSPAWTILRAAPLYGRRGRHLAASLLVIGPMMRLGSPLLPYFRGGPRGAMVHAEDVARALLFVLSRDDTAYQVYNVADGDALSLGERIQATFDAYGLNSMAFGSMPRSFLRWFGEGFQRPGLYHGADLTALAAWRLVVLRHGLKPALRPHLDRESLPLLYDDFHVNADKLRKLGWRPRFSSFAAGWAEVLRWYQAERWVPRYH